MEWKQIKQLSDKYWKADTTIDEEKELKKNIISSNDPSDPQEVDFFKTLDQFSTSQLSDDFDDRLFARIESEKKPRRFYAMTWFQMAASILIALGILGTFGLRTYQDQQLARKQEAREAFEIAKSALFMVSEKMNKGSQYTKDGLSKFEETHQKIKNQNFNN